MEKTNIKDKEEIIDKYLSKETISKKVKKSINSEDYSNLLYKFNELEEKVTYNDANLKANYILPIIVINYYLLSIIFHFEKVLGYNNLITTFVFAILTSLYFYKENKIIATKVLKKIFLKEK